MAQEKASKNDPMAEHDDGSVVLPVPDKCCISPATRRGKRASSA